MNYIYDILVNLENNVYEFYEWNINDNIKHLKKIPIFKVNNKLMNDLYYNDIRINRNFLNKIYNKTETYSFGYIKYICIFTNGIITLAINFNNNGEILNKSRLMLEEEQEVIEESIKLDIINIEYKVIKRLKKINKYLTRKEESIKNILLNELNDAYHNDISKISYMYYEYYDRKSNDINKMYNRLLTSINNSFNKKHIRLYNDLLIEIGK